jgi:hypothetical protein
MRYKIRTLLLVPIVCTIGLVCSRIPVTSWSGAQLVNLPVVVVDGKSGRPISRAEVELFHSFAYERAPVSGRTDADGQVVLRNWFYASGVDYLVGGTEHVTFSPFMIRATAKGFSEFRAFLAGPVDAADVKATAPPLNLRYPVSEPVKVPLTPSSPDAGR